MLYASGMNVPPEPKHPVLLALADALHEHIVRTGATVLAISRQLGVTAQYTHRLARGDGFPSPALQCRMRHQLGIDFNALLDSVDPADLDPD